MKEAVDVINDRIRELEAERDEANVSCEALAAKVRSLSAHESCGCSVDRPDDLCMHHSPQLTAAQARIAELEAACGVLGKALRAYKLVSWCGPRFDIDAVVSTNPVAASYVKPIA